MQSIIKIFAVCAIALGVAAGASAELAQDVVSGPGAGPVRGSKFGNCVVTKWTAKDDICAPARPKVVEQHIPAPQPVAPQPVTKLEREQLTIYFGFNKAELIPESKVKLDQIADAVNRSPKVIKVDIVGYTDEIGSDSYNTKLSLRRANAVKAYIDAKMRIPADVMGLRGLGEQNPVVDCSKVTKRKQKIACMAKDRRVEIEFEFQQ